MKNMFSFVRNSEWLKMILAVIIGVFAVVTVVQAATTISTNIATDGTLLVNNATSTITNLVMVNSTSTNATTTAFAATGRAFFTGGVLANSASSTINNLDMVNSTSTNATSTTMNISTNIKITGTGVGALENAGTASTSKLQLGGDNTSTTAGATTTINGLATGFCTFASVTITATSSDTVLCTGATGVRSGDRVFVTATSSLPHTMYIQAASSSAANVIQLRIFYVGNLTNATLATGINSVWYWATR